MLFNRRFNRKLNSNYIAGMCYLIGNIFDRAIAFITIPIFTRILSQQEYGVLCTYLSWESMLSVIVNLSLANSIRSAYVDYRNDFDRYISSISFLSVFSGVVWMILAMGVSYHVHIFQIPYLMILCVFQAMCESIIGIYKNKYMMEVAYIKRTLLCSIPNILISLLSIILILSIYSNKYLGRIWAYIIINSVLTVILLVYSVKKGGWGIDIKQWKYAMKFSLPLIFHSLSQVVLSQSDRTMITLFRSEEETAVYSLIYNFSMIISVMSGTIANVWLPWFTKKMMENKKDEINTMCCPAIEFVSLLGCMVMLVSPEIIQILAPENYWKGKYLVPIIVMASVLIYWISFYLDLEYFTKNTKHIMTNTIIAAVVNVILNMFFIPQYGAIAATLTTIVSYIISFYFHYRYARKIDSYLYPIKIFRVSLILIIATTIAMYIFMDFIIVRYLIMIMLGLYALKGLKGINVLRK